MIKKIGLVLFFIALIWAIAWGVIGSLFSSQVFNNLTLDELNQTNWALTGPLFTLWGVGGVPLSALLAAIGLLLYSGAKGWTVVKYGTGIFLGIIISMAFGSLRHIPPPSSW